MGNPILLTAVLLVLAVIGANLHKRLLKRKLEKATVFLRQQHDFLQSTLNSIAEGVIVTNSEGIIIFSNRPAWNFSGFGPQEMTGKHFSEVLKFKKELTGQDITIPYQDIMESRYVLRREDDILLENKEGSELFVGFSVAPIIKDKDLSEGVVIVFWDLSAQRDVRLALAESEAKFRGIFEVASDAIYLIGLDGVVVDANPAAAKMLFYTRDQLIGKRLSDFTSKEGYRKIKKIIEEAGGYKAVALTVDQKRKDGTFVAAEVSLRLCTMGQEKRMVMLARDVTERKKYDQAIKHLALYDALTNLPNRNLFNEQIKKALHRAKRNKYKTAVMFLDLDCFKSINDKYGHRIGDLLLKGVGQRISGILRQEDTVARLGGDEFAVLLPQITTAADAGVVAEKICREIRKPWFISGYNFTVTLSIGIAIYPQDGENGEELLKNADLAMYNTKLNGKDNYQFYGSKV